MLIWQSKNETNTLFQATGAKGRWSAQFERFTEDGSQQWRLTLISACPWDGSDTDNARNFTVSSLKSAKAFAADFDAHVWASKLRRAGF
jgi:hypothetical protein